MPNSTDTEIQDWWRWFADRDEAIHKLESPDDPFWDETVSKLKRVHPSLWFEMSGEDDSGCREFVVTAEGDVDAFSFVDSLVSTAPELSRWQFVALKPAMGFEFSTTYEGIRFDPRRMWFLPLQSESDPGILGIRVGVPDYNPRAERETQNAVMVIVDTAIGERSAALDIAHLEVGDLPSDPDGSGYIELPDLPAYIAFFRRKNGTSADDQ